MSFVVDFASSYKTITGVQLMAIGASGWIAYTGCNNTAKNISKSRFQEYIDTGIPGALVIENGTQDVLGGEKAGASLAQHVMAGAEALGYDVAHCALATSADFNETTATQYAETVDCMGAFGSLVPVPVYYGDGDSIDHVIPATRCVYGWQSDSTSFSPSGTSSHARLQQIYNDPRAKGLVVDVNNILESPLYFMGENVTTPGDITAAVWAQPIAVPTVWQPKDANGNSTSPFQDAAWVLSQSLSVVTTLFEAWPKDATGQLIPLAQVVAANAAQAQPIDYEALAAALAKAGVFPTVAQIGAEVDRQLLGRTLNVLTAATVGDLPAAPASDLEGTTS